MKLRKIFAGMAASAIAMSTMAVVASADANLEAPFNAGVCFQTNQWDFRDSIDKSKQVGDTEARFPGQAVGVSGGLGFDSNISVSDVQIQYDGTYTVSIDASGTLTGLQADDGTTYDLEWQLNDPANEETPDDERFNILSVGTDLVLDDKPKNTGDVATINGSQLSFTDCVAEWGGNSFPCEAYAKGDASYLTICFSNAYDDFNVIENSQMPARGDVITLKFTISGLGADPANGGGDTSSTAGGDTSSTAGGDTSSAAGGDSSKAGDASSKSGSTGGTTGGTTNAGGAAGTSAAAGGSDATDTSAKTGATAGLIFAGITLAGAAVVVSKRK